MAKETEFKKYDNPQDELAALQLSLVKAQLENAEIEKQEALSKAEERRLNLQELKERSEHAQLKRTQARENRINQGRLFAQTDAREKAQQDACSHKKGGIVSPRDMSALSIGGDGVQFAVLKHRMIDGNLWVRCLRCSKTWTPPKKENFFFDRKRTENDDFNKILKAKKMPYEGPQAGIYDERSFAVAIAEYKTACAYPTQNKESASVLCRFMAWDEATGEWSDARGKAEFDKSMLNTTLR